MNKLIEPTFVQKTIRITLILFILILNKAIVAQDTMPQYSLGNDTAICLGTYIILSPGLPDSCPANYLWNDGRFEPYKIITKPGTYWVDVESPCGSFRDTIIIDIISCLPGCESFPEAGIFGAKNENVLGKSIAPTPKGDGFYVAGTKNDSVCITRFNLNGELLWARTIEIVSGERHSVSALLVDPAGILTIAGNINIQVIGSTNYIFKYDPVANAILWAREYRSEIGFSKSFSLIQDGINGNYFMATEGGVLEISKDNGDIIKVIAKHNFGIVNLIKKGNFIYGVGIILVGNEQMPRQTMFKINTLSGEFLWNIVGDKISHAAGEFGPDLIITDNEIYSIYSNVDNEIFIQKTDLNGNILWLKYYKMPGISNWANEIIKSGNGFIVYGFNHDNQALILFKIDIAGNVEWAKTYYMLTNYNSYLSGGAVNQIIEIANQLIFTSFTSDSTITGSALFEMVIGRTTLTGDMISSCINQSDLHITVSEVNDPPFLSVLPINVAIEYEVTNAMASVYLSRLEPRVSCIVSDTIFHAYSASICAGTIIEGYDAPGVYTDTFPTTAGCDSIRVLVLTPGENISKELNATICDGSSFEGYEAQGIYADTFSLPSGCDSIRTLRLQVISCLPIIYYDLDACQSVMANGSHMDYSEFIPAYPYTLTCGEVSAEHLSRNPGTDNKHSCTPGINAFPAMCVNTSASCDYVAGGNESVVFEFSLQPEEDSIVRITGLEFYEKGPATYDWINGPNGPNNYPEFYGLRILKNGNEIFRQSGVPTNPVWTLQQFDFSSDSLFMISENSAFRIELLPYCPTGNGAAVSVWDIDEIKIFGGCMPVADTNNVIIGEVYTREDIGIPEVKLHITNSNSFDDYDADTTDEGGTYSFNNLVKGGSYLLRGYKNNDSRNGVSTLDLIHMQRHLLGITPFTQLYQFIAADINRSGNISVLDLLELRKLILGIYSSFPNNTSWRFSYLPNGSSGGEITDWNEVAGIEYLENDTQKVNFVGVKIGDLNGNAKVDLNTNEIESRGDGSYPLIVQGKKPEAGKEVVLEIKARNSGIVSGMQFSIELEGVVFRGLEGLALPLSKEHHFFHDGLLSISWNEETPVEISAGETLFRITVTPQQAGFLSEMLKLNSNLLQPEAYGEDLHIHRIELEIEDHSLDHAQFDLLKIEPNPASDHVKIHFGLMNDGLTEIRIMDISGKVLHVLRKFYSSGHHTEEILLNNFPSDGILCCQVISNGYTRTERFVKSGE